MRFWPHAHRKQHPEPSPEAQQALWQARRSLLDAECLDQAAADVARRLRATQARNHFAEAIVRSIRRQA